MGSASSIRRHWCTLIAAVATMFIAVFGFVGTANAQEGSQTDASASGVETVATSTSTPRIAVSVERYDAAGADQYALVVTNNDATKTATTVKGTTTIPDRIAKAGQSTSVQWTVGDLKPGEHAYAVADGQTLTVALAEQTSGNSGNNPNNGNNGNTGTDNSGTIKPNGQTLNNQTSNNQSANNTNNAANANNAGNTNGDTAISADSATNDAGNTGKSNGSLSRTGVSVMGLAGFALLLAAAGCIILSRRNGFGTSAGNAGESGDASAGRRGHATAAARGFIAAAVALAVLGAGMMIVPNALADEPTGEDVSSTVTLNGHDYQLSSHVTATFVQPTKTVIPVAGEVKDDNGQLVKNTRLTFTATGEQQVAVTTDENGYFAAHLTQNVRYDAAASQVKATLLAKQRNDVTVRNIAGSITLGRGVTEGTASAQTNSSAIYLDAKDYRLSADGKTVTVTAGKTGDIVSGDIVVLAPQGDFDGKVIRVATVSTTAAGLTFTGADADLAEAFDNIRLNNTTLDATKVEVDPADGVTATNLAKPEAGRTLKRAARIGLGGEAGQSLNYEFNYVKDLKVTKKVAGKVETRKFGYVVSKTTFASNITASAYVDFISNEKSNVTLDAKTDFNTSGVMCASYSNENMLNHVDYSETECAGTEEADKKDPTGETGSKQDTENSDKDSDSDKDAKAADDKSDGGTSDGDKSDDEEAQEFEGIKLTKTPLVWRLPWGFKVESDATIVTHSSGHFRGTMKVSASAEAKAVLQNGKVTATAKASLDPNVELTAAAKYEVGLLMDPTLKVLGHSIVTVKGEPGVGMEVKGHVKVENGVLKPGDASASWEMYGYANEWYSFPILEPLGKLPEGNPLHDLGKYAEDQEFKENPVARVTLSKHEATNGPKYQLDKIRKEIAKGDFSSIAGEYCQKDNLSCVSIDEKGRFKQVSGTVERAFQPLLNGGVSQLSAGDDDPNYKNVSVNLTGPVSEYRCDVPNGTVVTGAACKALGRENVTRWPSSVAYFPAGWESKDIYQGNYPLSPDGKEVDTATPFLQPTGNQYVYAPQDNPVRYPLDGGLQASNGVYYLVKQ